MQDQHPEDIKAALRKAGTSLSILAREHGVSKSILTVALRQPSPKWAEIIASALGCDARLIWPAWYAQRDARQAQRAALSAQIEADRLLPRRRGRPPLIRQVAA